MSAAKMVLLMLYQDLAQLGIYLQKKVQLGLPAQQVPLELQAQLALRARQARQAPLAFREQPVHKD
jgi:hypothetical protein